MQLKDRKIVITAGGTIEEMDPVRYLTNYSSGKMGIALADVAFENGADVTLISTVDVENKNYKIKKVKSAIDMQKAVDDEFTVCDCIIMAAAVADYRPKTISNQKIKKTTQDEITITFIKNPDILKEISQKKHSQIVVGFCAESENLVNNAKEKIKAKGCDYLVANDISRKDIGFSSNYNEVIVFNKNGEMQKIQKADKKSIATQIFEIIYG